LIPYKAAIRETWDKENVVNIEKDVVAKLSSEQLQYEFGKIAKNIKCCKNYF